MVCIRRGVDTSTHVCSAIPRLPGLPLRGLSGPAAARTGVQSRMIQSGAPGRHLSSDDPVWGRRLLLLDPPRMIQSGVSGIISPDDALVVLWLLLLVLPRIFQSRALHGLVTAVLHHQRLLLFAASLLVHGLVLLAAASRHHGLVHLFTSLRHHALVLIMVALPLLGIILISAPLQHHGLDLMAASLHHRGLIHRSVSLLHHGPVLINAARISPASSSSLYHCIFMALPSALLPDMTPSLYHVGRGLLSPSPLAATFP